MLSLHLKGTSIRTIATMYKIGIKTAYQKIKDELLLLPHNNQVTHDYCNRKRFRGEIVADGKYVKVRGYKRKIPFLYGIDYHSHDIPVCMLATSESFEAWVQYFTKLKNADYPVISVTCDDNEAIKMAAQYVFPNVIIQLCHVHFLENMRKFLKVRTDPTYKTFFQDIHTHLFKDLQLSKEGMERRIRWRAPRYTDDQKKVYVLNYIFTHAELLCGHTKAYSCYRAHCPLTTNMIESYNSQLEGRLKTIQGFTSFQSAERWLAAWILRRRLTKFTDCKTPFEHLNGACSLEKTKRGKLQLPNFFKL